MARAEIYIEDTDTGVALRVNYIGGGNVESGAHQLANILRKKLDEMVENGELMQHGNEQVESVGGAPDEMEAQVVDALAQLAEDSKQGTPAAA